MNANTDMNINTSNVEYMCASPYTHIPSQFGDPQYLIFMNYFRYFSRLFWQPFLPHLILKAILECLRLGLGAGGSPLNERGNKSLKLLASELLEHMEAVTVRAGQRRPQELVTLRPLHLAGEWEGGAPLS